MNLRHCGFLLLLLMNGCYAVHTPKKFIPRPDTQNQASLPADSLKDGSVMVGLERCKKIEIGQCENLRRDLQATRLFARVAYVDEYVNPPDLVAQITERVSTKNPLPFLTIFTLGIFPTVWRDAFGDVFSLRKPDSNAVCTVDFRVHSAHVMGWFAAPFRLFPGWGSEEWNPRSDDRFTELFAQRLLSKKLVIEKLLQSP